MLTAAAASDPQAGRRGHPRRDEPLGRRRPRSGAERLAAGLVRLGSRRRDAARTAGSAAGSHWTTRLPVRARSSPPHAREASESRGGAVELSGGQRALDRSRRRPRRGVDDLPGLTVLSLSRRECGRRKVVVAEEPCAYQSADDQARGPAWPRISSGRPSRGAPAAGGVSGRATRQSRCDPGIELAGGLADRRCQADSGPLGRDALARLVSRPDGLGLFHVGVDDLAKGVRRRCRRIVEHDQAPRPWRPASEGDAVELPQRLEH